MNDKDIDNYFYEGHLSDEAIALMAESLIFNKEEKLPLLLLRHAEECLQCKKEIFATYEILRDDESLKSLKYHPFLGNINTGERKNTHIKKTYFIRIAAIFLLLIGLVGILIMIRPERFLKYPKRQSVLLDTLKYCKKNNDTPIEKRKQIYSVNKRSTDLNMVKSDFFENLIVSQYRGENIEVLTPSIAQKYAFPATITFRFKGEISSPVSLFIYDNKEKKIFERDSILSNSYRLEKSLSVGLYYWKLLRNDDLVYVGKFMIK